MCVWVSLSPCTESAVPRCPVSSPKCLCRAELGRHHCHVPLKVRKGSVASWTQEKTDVASRMKRWFLAVEFHLFPCSLHLSLGISDEEILLPISPQFLLSLLFFSTGHLVLAAAALYLLFSFFMNCLQGIFLKSCSSIMGV